MTVPAVVCLDAYQSRDDKQPVHTFGSQGGCRDRAQTKISFPLAAMETISLPAEKFLNFHAYFWVHAFFWCPYDSNTINLMTAALETAWMAARLGIQRSLTSTAEMERAILNAAASGVRDFKQLQQHGMTHSAGAVKAAVKPVERRKQVRLVEGSKDQGDARAAKHASYGHVCNGPTTNSDAAQIMNSCVFSSAEKNSSTADVMA